MCFHLGCTTSTKMTEMGNTDGPNPTIPPPIRPPVVLERSRAAKLRELLVVVIFFGAMAVAIFRPVFDDRPEGVAPVSPQDRPPTAAAAMASPSGTGSPERQTVTTFLVEHPPRFANQTSALFRYAADPPATSFECRLDDAPFAPCPPDRQTYSNLKDGPHTFQVRAASSTNVSSTVASYAWAVDTVAPTLTIKPMAGTYVSVQTVAFSVSEPAAIYYTDDGQEPTESSSRYTKPFTVAAPSTITAVAVDQAGNRSWTVRASYNFSAKLREGFESGDLSQWTTVRRVAIVRDPVWSGDFAARATSAGDGPAWVGLDLGVQEPELFLQMRFVLVQQGANPVTLARFLTPAGAPLVRLFVTESGRLAIQMFQETLRPSSISVEQVRWHEAQVHIRVAGAQSVIEVWFDGVLVGELSGPVNLGSFAASTIRLGEQSRDRTFDLVFDDVALDTEFIPSSFIILTEPTPAGSSTPEP